MTRTFDSYRAALRFVRERSDYAHGHISNPRSGPSGAERGLLRMRALLDTLGAPDRHYSIAHIAGSKGKGSTAAFLASIGRVAGYRTGLSTSPHLHSFRERIAIDGFPVDERRFADLAFECQTAIERLERDHPALGSITAFELLTAMGLLDFAERACDLAVVEVGLGGTFDATNVIDPAVAVITRLDLEHTQILGDSIVSIAENKAGIIAPGIPVVTTSQLPEARAVIEATAARLTAPLFIDGRDFGMRGTWRDFSWTSPGRYIDHLRTGMAGPHQMENASLAIAAWEQLTPSGFTASDAVIREGIRNTTLPGRFERVTIEDRIWILDGAHTPVAAAALATELLDEIGKPISIIAGFLNDKHPEPFLQALAPAVSELLLTEPPNPRAVATDALLLIADALCIPAVAYPQLADAIQQAIARGEPQSTIAITGSLALIAEARELLGLAIADPDPSDV